MEKKVWYVTGASKGLGLALVKLIFRAQGSGHFINISSNAGYIGFANAASYNATNETNKLIIARYLVALIEIYYI